MHRYINLDLSLKRAEDIYQVRIDSPAGQDEAGTRIRADLFNYSDLLRELSTNDATQEYGRELFAALFPNSLESLYRRSLDRAKHEERGLRIRLRVSDTPELSAIPWEYLYDPVEKRFVAQSTRTSIVRYQEMPQEAKHVAVSPPIRILVAIASPAAEMPISGDEEWSELNRRLKSSIENGTIELDRLQPCTTDELRRRIRSAHVFHFVGHGVPTTPEESGGILLESNGEPGASDLYSYSSLANEIGDSPDLRLVFLNACSTADSSGAGAFDPAVERIVDRGVPALIAMRFDISNESATMLAAEFYQALADGFSIDAALAEGRKALDAEQDSTEWGYPVLFLRSVDSQLFNGEEQSENNETLNTQFLVDVHELKENESVFVPPQGKIVSHATELLRKNRLLILEGPPGVGKNTLAVYLARRLMEENLARPVFRMYWNTPVAALRTLQGAVVVATDFFGTSSFERDQLDSELAAVEHLCRENYLILTSSPRVLEEAREETRLDQASLLSGGLVNLRPKDYDVEERRAIVIRHLTLEAQRGRIGKEMAHRLLKAIENDTSLFGDLVLPSDLRRLVLGLGPKSTDVDLREALGRVANLRGEFSSWLFRPDRNCDDRDDLLCFFIAAICNGETCRESFWPRYEATANSLRKFMPRISIRPLPAFSASLRPYVEVDAKSWRFADRTIEEAVRKVLCEDVREFLGELLDELIRSISPPSSSGTKERLAFVDRTRLARRSVTAVLGELGRQELTPLLPTLDTLASAVTERIRLIACEVLESASRSKSQVGQVMRTIASWANDEESNNKRWAAVMACGRLQSTAPTAAQNRLRRLSRDPSYYVREAVSRAVPRYATVNHVFVAEQLTRLGADSSLSVRRGVSIGMRQLCSKAPTLFRDILEKWAVLESNNRLWTLTHTCWISGDPTEEISSRMLANAMAKNSQLVWSTLEDALQKKLLNVKRVLDRLEVLVSLRCQIAPDLGALVLNLRPFSEEQSWSRLLAWAKNGQANHLRLLAAHAVAHLSSIEPERTQPLVNLLGTDIDEEIAMTAILKPMKIISSDEIAELFGEDAREEETSDPEFDDWMWEVLG